MHAILVRGDVVVRNCEMISASGPVVAACGGGRLITEGLPVTVLGWGPLDSRNIELFLRKVQVCHNAANGVGGFERVDSLPWRPLFSRM
jgi:hypothetical protein